MRSPGGAVEDFPTRQDFFQERIKASQPAGDLSRGAHQEVQRQVVGPADSGDAAAAFSRRRAVVVHDHQQIHVTVPAGFAIGIRPEEYDLLGMEMRGDILDHIAQCRISEEFLGHIGGMMLRVAENVPALGGNVNRPEDLVISRQYLRARMATQTPI